MKNKLFLNCYLILLTGLIFFIGKENSYASVYTFFSDADAYVTQNVPDSGNGLARYLFATTHITPGQQIIEHIYFKFYLGDIPEDETISGAVLNLYPVYTQGSWVNLNHIGDDSWNESEISWNNRPDSGSTGTLLSWGYAGNAGSWLSLDIMANGEWNYQADQEDSFLSMMLSIDEQSQGAVIFCSKEHFAPYMPYLFVSTVKTPVTNPVPLPSTVWLLFFCLVAMVGTRKIKNRFS